MIRKIALILLLSTILFSSSKFTLDGVKNLKIMIVERTKFIDKEAKEELKSLIVKKLKKEDFTFGEIDSTTFIIEIKSIEVKDIYVLEVSLFLGEDVKTNREELTDTFAYTYMQSVLVESEFLHEDTLSAVDFLVCQFLEAYRDDKE